MTYKSIVEYYDSWTNNNRSNENAIAFTDMLMRKAAWALNTGNRVFVYDRKRTGQEIEKIYGMAEDIFCTMPQLRGNNYK